MTAPIDALALELQALGVGTIATDLFVENMPDATDGSLDTCTAIYSTGGGPPSLTKGDNTDSPSFQLRARALSSDDAKAKLLTAFQALHGLTETDVQGVHFKLIWYLQSDPVGLGRDEKQRFEFSQNLRAMVSGISR